MPDFAAFVRRLGETPVAPDANNPFAVGDNPYNALRRANLERYLRDVYERRTPIVLIGEAPGYRGMRLTGVPFGSRRVVLQGLPSLNLFGVGRGYVDVPEPGFEDIQGEQSSTIVWGTLAELGLAPLAWGAFPFHPHKPGLPRTNRAPRTPEVSTGVSFVRELLAIFQPQKVIAVGNVAHRQLGALGIDAVKIRHPAQGGKNDFVAGLRAESRGYTADSV